MKNTVAALVFVYLSTVTLVTAWDYFVFAQSWPPATCADAKRKHHTCHVAQEIHTWTIHGLWPTIKNTKGPVNCNSTMTFNETLIANLTADLLAYWPNIYNDTAKDSFWSHEWTKHGTCCQDFPATLGEYNYFKTGLDMNKKYDFLRMLNDGGVKPSPDAQYSYQQFVSAIKNATGYTPVIQCTAYKLDNGTTYHLIDQIQMCLSKDFTPMTCNMDDLLAAGYLKPQSSCPLKYNFNYPPIDHV